MKINSLPGLPEIIGVLVPQPGFGAGLKGHLQAQGHFRTDAPLAVDDLGEAFAADPEQLRGPGDPQPQAAQQLLPKTFPRAGRMMHGIHALASPVIVFVIDNLHVLAVETKGYPPIGLHCNRPDGTAVAVQGVQPETGQIHIHRRGRDLEPDENTAELGGMPGLNPGLVAGAVKPFNALMEKAFYHSAIVTILVSTVKNTMGVYRAENYLA